MENKNTTPSFYWIDYETFGLSTQLDRPCQFAGVRTDFDLNIVSDPLVLYCKPADDYLPSIDACLVHGITPQVALDKGLREVDFIGQIHQELSTPNTCVVGYNNIRFDDEVTRHTLYRNFYNPYGWSYLNGNSRWDVVDLLRSCYALRPEGLKWPIVEQKPVFKLDRLSIENGIEHSNAHDALADVYATIEMARLVKERQPKLFSYFFSMRNKRKLRDLITENYGKPLVHISGKFGSKRGNTSWVLPVAHHPTNNNAIICIDLARDPAPLFELSVEELKLRLYTKYSDLLEGELPVPVKLIHLNKCPFLAPAKVLTPQNAQRLGIDRKMCLKNWEQLQNVEGYQQKLVEMYSLPNNFSPITDVDQMLYEGFFNDADKDCIERIRKSSPEHLSDIDTSFLDPRLSQLLFRFRARNFPKTLSAVERRQWRQHCQQIITEKMPVYLLRLAELRTKHQDQRSHTILQSLQEYTATIRSVHSL